MLSIEKLREEELDEARAIQSGLLPTQPVRIAGIAISHEFQPAALVGGDYLEVHKTGHPAQVMALLNKRLLLRGIPARYTAIK